MQAVILAAGQGTRMRPLTESTPKPLLPVGGRPLAGHVADAAVAAGADELVFVVGYRGEAVRDYFGARHAGVPVRYAVQREQTGTADAVRAAREHVAGEFAVLNGDNLYDAPSLESLFASGPGVGVHRVGDPSNYGVVSTADGRVTDVIEKPSRPPTDLANAGAYVLPVAALDALDVPASERGERELTDVLARVVETHDVTPVEIATWLDVGRPWELLAANERVLGDQSADVAGAVSEHAVLEGPVVVEEGATVKAGAVLEGPVLVRSDATVGPNAYLRGPALVDAGAKVGHSVEVKNSVLMAGASVAHLSYVGDSIVGRDANLGAGTNVANLRHDGTPVELTVKGDRVSTGRRKFGVVVGDSAKTAINTSLNAGVTLSPGATTGPGEVVTRDR